MTHCQGLRCIKVLIIFAGFGTNGNYYDGNNKNFELNPDYLVTLDQEDPKLIDGMDICPCIHITSVTSSMKKSSIERARACSKIKIRVLSRIEHA